MQKLLRIYNQILEYLARIIENIHIPLFLPGIGCGVLGLALPKVSLHMGEYASRLLRSLEYRGYDSTGAAFQGEDENIILLKDVGAPSILVKTLGIEKQSGKLFCGQVRWATFGAVDKNNAQPHQVKCKRHLYGAHNGNITNTPELKVWLTQEGHIVVSDNDGEMLVHTVEHFFDIEMDRAGNPTEKEAIKICMRQALINTGEKLIGSYAAVITEPITQTMWAMKAGSSLYFGLGQLEGMPFALASSDLTAVLRFTKTLVNLREGEFIEFNSDYYQVYAQKNLKFKRVNAPDEVYLAGDKIPKQPVLSKLRAEDVELKPEFEYYMEQEIYGQVESTGKLVKLFQGGSNSGNHMLELLNEEHLTDYFIQKMNELLNEQRLEPKLELFNSILNSAEFAQLLSAAQISYPAIFEVAVREDFENKYFFSNDKNTFIDLIGKEFDIRRMFLAKVFDSLSEASSVEEFEHSVQEFLKLIKNTVQNNRNAYTIACGTSFHATKIGALFFNEIAGVEIIPILPGDFRGEYSNCIKDNDLIIGVSQSGETKDLIDIFNDIEAKNLNIKKVVLVNNLNSTLGQEKGDLAIQILCGPEIAVPATKSFMNQITLLYYLAIRTAIMKLQELQQFDPEEQRQEKLEKLNQREQTLAYIPSLISETLENTSDIINSIAAKIYMEPSIHILATKISGVAMEGALKIRETVLNHAEGRESSEFKHGPNTILGKNTVFGVKNVRNFTRNFNDVLANVDEIAERRGISRADTRKIDKALVDYIFWGTIPFNLSLEADKLFKNTIDQNDFFSTLYRHYPLIYVTGPDERDVNLTISQINTHKIRGADTYVIAEENEQLHNNASENPHKGKYYGWNYVILPKTGDSLLTCFSASVVLQLLALKMSVRKMKKLDKLNVKDHGVHPDVPKNVSKSITVD